MPGSMNRLPSRGYAVIAAAALIAPLALATGATAQELGLDQDTQAYIVQLRDKPISAYDGKVAGMAATKPSDGEKVDVESEESQGYSDYLTTKQNKAVRSVGASTEDVIYRYDTALNGVAVNLTGQQAAAMRKAPDVISVWEREVLTLDTVTTPDYLGMTGDNGVWQQQFGGADQAGEGMVVGIIDTGIVPENPSFAALPDAEIPVDWRGECENGEDPDESANITCNNKLIGARSYNEDVEVDESDFLSPRDYDGHGSHTAGTAAGNNGVPMSINGVDVGEGSGMAPAAHVAAYKVFWQNGDGESRTSTVDLVAAIDGAVADGVDVINYSIGTGSGDTFVVTPVDVAFLFAADAGVFVSASAGNSGVDVGESSVDHVEPWLSTVAAGTHDRNVNKELTLGDDSTFEGVGVGPGVGPAPLVYAADIPASGATAKEAQECHLDIDPDADGNQLAIESAGAEGNIVICDRGTIARVDKSAAVDEAGGVGMVLANTNPADSLNGDFHSVPTVHLNSTNGDAVKAYEASNAEPTATIGEPNDEAVVAPEVAGFSSYGPELVGSGDLLKPDIMAPGVDVIAAVAPPGNDGKDFDSYSGTSMAAPHIAGLAALMMQQYPGWGPAAVKSAMMTTARTTNTEGGQIQRGGGDATALDYGSGEVVPGSAYNPGLVYDADFDDWFDYACAVDQLQLILQDPTRCDDVETDPSDLNYPTIAIGDLAGSQTVTRTVTNVSDTDATYTSAGSQAPEGIGMVITPATITVPAGGEVSFEVAFTQVNAPLDAYAFGALEWEGADATVTSQIAVQPTALATLDEIVDTGASGSRDYELMSGFAGTIETDVDGLVAADVIDVETVKDESTLQDGLGEFTVPAGTKLLRFATFGEDVPASDVDLNVLDPSGGFAGSSGSGGSDEAITIVDPDPGVWEVYVDLFSAEPSAVVPVNGFYVGESDEGNLTATPDSVVVTPGQQVDVTATWSGLSGDTRYLGQINYESDGDTVGSTLVDINVEGGAGDEVGRIAGENRFGTAAEIARAYPGDPDTVYIASGFAFADALSASSPASNSMVPRTMETGSLAAPVLLTRTDTLPDETVSALEDLDPSQVVVLGGPNAVSTDVEMALEKYGQVERIGGEDRYDTSSQIAQKLYPQNVPVAYVASGADDNFPDALSGGALAGSQDAPVVLVRSDRVDEFTQEALDHLNAGEVIVLGGPRAVSDAVYDAVGAERRLAGPTRYETAVAISEEFEADTDGTLVASGEKWPDALTGAALSGFLGQPLTLSKSNDVPDVVMAELDRLSPAQVSMLGGPKALTQDVEDELNASYATWAE